MKLKDVLLFYTIIIAFLLWGVWGLLLWTVPQPKEQLIEVTFDLKAMTQPCDGSVIFWQDTFLVKPITRRTGSNLTHAAIVLNGFVYEAVPPCVHKVLLADYLKEMKALKRGSYFVLTPKTPYTSAQLALMVRHAESQLGRPYVLRGYGKRVTRGIFCSQLVSDILEKSGRIKSGSFLESPGSLFEKLENLYDRK
jgi:hypothetical protein